MFQSGFRGTANEFLKFFVAGDEIGLGVYLDDGADMARDGDTDQTVGGDASCFLRGGGKTVLSQPVDGGFHFAVRLRQRRLAIHHSGAGLLPKLLDQGSSDLGHGLPSLIL